MNKLISIILLGLIVYLDCDAQQKSYGYKFSSNGDIVSDIFFIQNGYVLDSVSNTTIHITYSFEYNAKGKLKRDINFYRVLIVVIVNGRAQFIITPGTRDYYYNESGDIDSIGYGHWDDSSWVNDSSGYKFHYSNDGKLISKVYSTKDTVKRAEEFTYDSAEHIILDKVVEYGNMDTLITSREYDSQNRLTLRKYYNSGTQSTRQTETLYSYKYDSAGNVNCRTSYIESDSTLYGGYNFYLEFDENGKIVYELFSSQLQADSTWGENDDIVFNYDEYGEILKMGDVVRFHYNIDGNLDTLINLHAVYCGYLGNTATLIDTYGNNITLTDCAGYNNFYYSSFVTGTEANIVKDRTYTLFQNYPNPFNPTTTITYSMPTSGFVTLKIYNLLGSEIATLVNEEKNYGTYKVNWNAQNIPSGVYFSKITAGEYSKVIKMILLK